MPRGGRRHQNRPKHPRTITEFHRQLTSEPLNQMTLCYDESLYSGMILNNSGEGSTLLFIIPKVKDILRTGLTFSFNCNVILGPSLETEFQKFYVIMGMRGNISFVIGFALMTENTRSAFKLLYRRILSIEPRWKPQTIICSFNEEEVNAIKSVFPNTKIQGCWFYSCRSVWHELESLDLKSFCITNRTAYEHICSWTALPLLPFIDIEKGFIELKADLISSLQPILCSEYRRKFNSFFNAYRALWFEGINRKILPMRNGGVLRSNIEIEFCCRHLQANMEYHTNPGPPALMPFMKSLIAYSRFTIDNYLNLNDEYYESLEHSRSTWIDHVDIYRSSLKYLLEGRNTFLYFLNSVMCITPGYETMIYNAPQTITWNMMVNTTGVNNDESRFFIANDSTNVENSASDRVIPDVPGVPQAPVIPEIPIVLPPLVPFQHEEMDFEAIVGEFCCICLTEPPKIITSPCMHQCLCTKCYEMSTKIRPIRYVPHIPYYRCPLCRHEIDLYISVN